jgi:hypothetical protein
MLRMKVKTRADGVLEMSGVLRNVEGFGEWETTPAR